MKGRLQGEPTFRDLCGGVSSPQASVGRLIGLSPQVTRRLHARDPALAGRTSCSAPAAKACFNYLHGE